MEVIIKAIRAIHFTGLVNTVRTILYSFQRSWLEYRYGTRNPRDLAVIKPGELRDINLEPQGLRARFDNAAMELHFLAEDLVRATWEPGALPPPYAIAKSDWPPVEVEIEECDGHWSLKTSALTVRLDFTGNLTYQNNSSQILRQELHPERQGTAWVHQAVRQENEHFFGLGERAAPFNLAGGSYRLWNTDPAGGYGVGDGPLYLNIPVYLGLHDKCAYLVFFENSHDGRISFTETSEARFEGGALRYYLIPGPPGRALERYMELTGRPPLPPRWAFGFHQSRWGYKSAEDVRQVAEGFEKHNLPLSAIHLDIDYMDGYRVFTVDSQRFPNLPELADDLHRRDVRLVAILDPGVKVDPTYSLYKEGISGGHFCTGPNGEAQPGLVWPGWSVFPDFTRPKTRAWWGSQYPQLIDLGLSGIWHDMNEPAAFAAWGELTLPQTTQHSMEGRGGNHREAHNLYGLLMNQAGYTSLRQHYPKRRPWVLTRSGWAGTARYAWHWTGDIESSWACLKQTVATLLGLGLSGIPFSGSDIGGFLGDPDAELFLRWFQLGVFTPLFRVHSARTASRREPWTFDEGTLNSIRAALQLRTSLLPYLYTIAWQAHQRGLPLMRPLFWDHPVDETLWEVADSFMLGPDLLVAPVLESGVQSRRVRLPPGRWYDFHNQAVFRGPGERDYPVIREQIPVFTRGGSILPMEREGRLTLHLYPSDDRSAEGSIYLDVGEGPIEQESDWRYDQWKLSPLAKGGQIVWESKGNYPFPYQQVDVELHGFELRQARINDEIIASVGHIIETTIFNRMTLFFD